MTQQWLSRLLQEAENNDIFIKKTILPTVYNSDLCWYITGIFGTVDCTPNKQMIIQPAAVTLKY